LSRRRFRGRRPQLANDRSREEWGVRRAIIAPPDLGLVELTSKWIEFMHHGRRIAVIFVGRHDAVVAVAGLEDDDADHEVLARFQARRCAVLRA